MPEHIKLTIEFRTENLVIYKKERHEKENFVKEATVALMLR